MSSYSNYLGAKKCCANNLAKTVTGPQGPKGSQGALGPYGQQGATGSQGFRGATGLCCRGPPGFTGSQGATGEKGVDGAAGGNGGLPLFLNYSINSRSGPPPVPRSPPISTSPAVVNGSLPGSGGSWYPALQTQPTSTNGVIMP